MPQRLGIGRGGILFEAIEECEARFGHRAVPPGERQGFTEGHAATRAVNGADVATRWDATLRRGPPCHSGDGYPHGGYTASPGRATWRRLVPEVKVDETLPLWVFFVATLALAVGTTEVGFRIGRLWQRLRPHQGDEAGGVMVGATLTLLAFFLAFLMGMATNRFDGRRALVMEEANAIGTVWLRAGYLPDTYSALIRFPVEAYTAQRLRLENDHQRADALDQSNRLMKQVWTHTQDVVRAYPNSQSVSLFVASVNEMMDLGSRRAVSFETWPIPWSIWMTIYFAVVLTMMLVGLHAGITNDRNALEVVVLGLVLAVVLNLIIDLDRPNDGMLTVSQAPLLDLLQQQAFFAR